MAIHGWVALPNNHALSTLIDKQRKPQVTYKPIISIFTSQEDDKRQAWRPGVLKENFPCK